MASCASSLGTNTEGGGRQEEEGAQDLLSVERSEEKGNYHEMFDF